MEEDTSVFSSDVQRAQKPLQNNLYELFDVVPAKPVKVVIETDNICDFQPICGKQYVPKKRNKLKVRTVRDIRNIFEKDVYTYLPNDLEKQQSILLRKITSGSLKNENTKTLAKNMLKCNKPISRSAWQMLMNLNPEEYTHSIQYVLWKGKTIRLNGSKGGKHKFACKYDLSNRRAPFKTKCSFKPAIKKKSLLNSLLVKFKAGPLTKKKFLDDSYQKYNVGNTELVNLPQPGISIQPAYGVVLEPMIANFLQKLRNENGVVSEKWAEFALSVLGTKKNTDLIQNKQDSFVTFDLHYKSDQRRILMRHDVDRPLDIQENICTDAYHPIENDFKILPEVKCIVNDILACVEISLQQDTFYSEENQPRGSDEFQNINMNTKDKNNKRRYCELDRLDVTVIRLPEAAKEKNIETCQEPYCILGCICTSLQYTYNLKQHCGRTECMFKCKCDFSKYKATDSFENECPELLPGLIKLDKEMSSKLSKEEQKFHQTVVLTGDKSIFLKPERRNWKASKRYADFYSNMCLKTDIKMPRELVVVAIKLNLVNVESWCMVHNLYKCFCKGQYVENSVIEKKLNSNESKVDQIKMIVDETFAVNNGFSQNVNEGMPCSKLKSLNINGLNFPALQDKSTCARVCPYKKRKFLDSYYKATHNKIIEMEKNDDKLHNKMMSIINRLQNVDGNDFKENELMTNKKSAAECSKLNEFKRMAKNKSGHKESNELEDNQIDNNSNNSPPNKDEENSASPCIILESTDDDMTEGLFCALPTFNAEETPAQSYTFNENKDQSILSSMTKSTSKRFPNKTKLVSWLESSYKHYKQRVENGNFKTTLEPPKAGKLALYPWEFILNRYKERKNLFLISKEKPFRIYMAVDISNPFFENFINIDDIRFADLHKYPITIKNLLTNARDLKDNFCILSGLSHCWELIGSVTKIEEKTEKTDSSDVSDTENWNKLSPIEYKIRHEKSDMTTTQRDSDESIQNALDDVEIQEINEKHEGEPDGHLASSRWFVMNVENDFTEILFHKKGFFVKYESILRAIQFARVSGKAVRLSSQKCKDINNDPPFGLYAMPNASEHCVFVGPYEEEEPLGIETVKPVLNNLNVRRTRGSWITTKKIDNPKLIESPFSFMPQLNKMNSNELVTLDKLSDQKNLNQNLQKELNKTDKVKPIKIPKKNGFYHLSQKGLLISSHQEKQNSLNVTNSLISSTCFQNQEQIKPLLLNTSILKTKKIQCAPTVILNDSKTESLLKKIAPLEASSKTQTNEAKRPIAEIAPQIKVAMTETRTESGCKSDVKKSVGMFILKPEEINKRIMENKTSCNTESSPSVKDNYSNLANVEEIDQDIENFLANSMVCTLPKDDILIISDEEDNNMNCDTKCDGYTYVYIESRNIENLGWIRGRRNVNKELSFEFPGFKFTDFYSDEEAFSKINQLVFHQS